MSHPKKRSEKNPSKSSEENPDLAEVVKELRQAIYDPKNGLLVRLTKIETTLSNLKWLIPLTTGVTLLLIQVGLKLAGFL